MTAAGDEEPSEVLSEERCSMYCDQPALYYVSAVTSVPMTDRQPLCAKHVATYGRLAVEVAVASPLRYRTVQVVLEPVVIANLIDRLDRTPTEQDVDRSPRRQQRP